MNKDEIIVKLTDIYKEIFEEDKIVNIENTSPDNIDSWSSLKHVLLIDAIEKSFSINFDLDDMLEMNNTNDIIKGIENKLK